MGDPLYAELPRTLIPGTLRPEEDSLMENLLAIALFRSAESTLIQAGAVPGAIAYWRSSAVLPLWMVLAGLKENVERRVGSARPWAAPLDLAELIAPAPEGLKAYQPQQRYLLIEERGYCGEALDGQANFAAALFRLEQLRSLADLQAAIRSLQAWWGERAPQPLRLSITRWFLRQLGRKIGAASIPDVNDLLEIDSMLSEVLFCDRGTRVASVDPCFNPNSDVGFHLPLWIVLPASIFQ